MSHKPNAIQAGAKIDTLHREIQAEARMLAESAAAMTERAVEIGALLSKVKAELARTKDAPSFSVWLAENVHTFKLAMAKNYVSIYQHRRKVLAAKPRSIREALLAIKAGRQGENVANALARKRERPQAFTPYQGPRREDYTPTADEEKLIELYIENGIMSRRKAIELFRFHAEQRAAVAAEQAERKRLASSVPETPAQRKARKRREALRKLAKEQGKTVTQLRAEAEAEFIERQKQANALARTASRKGRRR